MILSRSIEKRSYFNSHVNLFFDDPTVKHSLLFILLAHLWFAWHGAASKACYYFLSVQNSDKCLISRFVKDSFTWDETHSIEWIYPIWPIFLISFTIHIKSHLKWSRRLDMTIKMINGMWFIFDLIGTEKETRFLSFSIRTSTLITQY